MEKGSVRALMPDADMQFYFRFLRFSEKIFYRKGCKTYLDRA